MRINGFRFSVPEFKSVKIRAPRSAAEMLVPNSFLSDSFFLFHTFFSITTLKLSEHHGHRN
jgi:hypothetical protein